MLLLGLTTMGFWWYVVAVTAGAIYAPADARLPHQHVALVFGAGLTPSGEPSAVLYDRVVTAAALYRRGKVDKLLLSGDNHVPEYNEPAAMRRTALALGVADRDIVLDYAGFRTYDSCYRARDVFGLQAMTLVTNGYHLPRALYICRALGLDAVGVTADRQTYPVSAKLGWQLREMPALLAARWWLTTGKSPRFLGPRLDVDG